MRLELLTNPRYPWGSSGSRQRRSSGALMVLAARGEDTVVFLPKETTNKPEEGKQGYLKKAV